MIAQKLKNTLGKIDGRAKLIAVSKKKSSETVMEAYNAGHRDFGENYVQELVDKYEAMPKDINWHVIGHLQTNKVKFIAPFVHLIHSVDSAKLLKEINKQAKKNERVIHCLLQLQIAKEDTKTGFDQTELLEFIGSDDFKSLENIQIDGLMGMATFTENEKQIAAEFEELHNFSNMLKDKFSMEQLKIRELSMGMSADWELAIAHGSTMVRIGSSIFGTRN